MNRVFRWISLLFFGACVVVPVLIVFYTTFKTRPQFYQDPTGFPRNPTAENYADLFRDPDMLQYFMNTIYFTFFAVLLILWFSSMIAYAIVRIGGKKGALLFAFFSIAMTVPPQVNMIPLYIMMFKLQLTNSLTGLIMVNIAVLSPLAIFILTGFMRTVSKEMIEAATIDGAGEWQIYSRIALPISLPSIAATSIFLIVIVWNELFYPLLLISDKAKKTLPLALLQYRGEYTVNLPGLFSAVMMASAPMVIAYLFLQRYFIAGITAGSVKG